MIHVTESTEKNEIDNVRNLTSTEDVLQGFLHDYHLLYFLEKEKNSHMYNNKQNVPQTASISRMRRAMTILAKGDKPYGER